MLIPLWCHPRLAPTSPDMPEMQMRGKYPLTSTYPAQNAVITSFLVAVFLVAVGLWLVRARHIKSEVLSLWLSQLGQVHTQCIKMQASNHFVKVLR